MAAAAIVNRNAGLNVDQIIRVTSLINSCPQQPHKAYS